MGSKKKGGLEIDYRAKISLFFETAALGKKPEEKNSRRAQC